MVDESERPKGSRWSRAGRLARPLLLAQSNTGAATARWHGARPLYAPLIGIGVKLVSRGPEPPASIGPLACWSLAALPLFDVEFGRALLAKADSDH